MRRRGKGEGSIGPHSSGMLRARVSLGIVNGRRLRLTSYHHTPEAAQAWIDAQNLRLRRGDGLPSKLPLGEWLAVWLTREAGRVSPHTLQDYRHIVDKLNTILDRLPNHGVPK